MVDSVPREKASASADQERDVYEKPPATAVLEVMGEESRPIDPEVNRRVLRKIDLFLMPAMVFGTVQSPSARVSKLLTQCRRIWTCLLRQGEFCLHSFRLLPYLTILQRQFSEAPLSLA